MNPLPNSRSQRSSDPYRIARKTHSPADSYDSSNLRSESEAHSRSASDSSTSRLASQPTYDRRWDDYYADDPYAPRQANYRQHMRQGTPESHDTQTTANSSTVPLATQQQQQQQQQQQKQQQNEDYQAQKANSYLPYSHHPPGKNGEVYQPPATSMLLESEHMPSFTSPHGREGGVGSLLQDNIVMDMVDTPIRTHHKETSALDPLPPLDKKKRRRCCGLGRKRLAAIIVAFVVVIVLVWYFVWPRTFEMQFNDANMYGNNAAQWTPKDGPFTQYEGSWIVSMNAKNYVNWVPTHVSRLDLAIYDSTTGTRFASGSNDTSFALAPKVEEKIYFIIDINYQVSSPSDPTMQHLSASCYIYTAQPNQQSQNPTQNEATLHLTFEVTYHIAGLAWAPQTRQNVEINCPN
ncbi:hypothetical protein BCR42DRAFT_425178 [Absidia repens]|uniref:Uncharacterized protein n=1 Tax=Absidia repens TaxID=90262 RepID=A0A1X2I2L6_9FUNG|nr:hypothetical protein BCR42DRAFT_425178 [Absidia repens]